MKLSHISLAVLSAIALAACGGSGSSNQVTAGSGNDKKDKKEEEKVVVAPKFSQVELQLGSGLVGNNQQQLMNAKTTPSIQASNFPGTTKAKSYVEPKGDFKTALGKVAAENYFANPALYNEDGYLNVEATKKPVGDNVKIDVFYKDGDKYLQAYIAQDAQDDNKVKFFKQKIDGTINKAAPLSASELLQPYSNDFIEVHGISLLGQDLAVTNDAGLKRFPKLDRSKIKVGEVVETSINLDATLNSFKKTANGQVNPTNAISNTTNFSDIYGDNVTNNSGIVEAAPAKKVTYKGDTVKAYNLPKTFVAITFDKNGLTGAADNVFTGSKADGTTVLSSDLDKLREFPVDVSATYNGKVLTAKETSDLAMTVVFGNGNNYKITDASIKNRGNNELDLNLAAPVKSAGALNSDYTLDLKFAEKDDNTGMDNNEYSKLVGKFYGVNAEETAGKVLNSTNVVKGVYAAQKK